MSARRARRLSRLSTHTHTHTDTRHLPTPSIATLFYSSWDGILNAKATFKLFMSGCVYREKEGTDTVRDYVSVISE